MNHPEPGEERAPETPGNPSPLTAPSPPTDAPSDAGGGLDPGAPRPLSAAEQMALYEKELKEEDWGHQPC